MLYQGSKLTQEGFTPSAIATSTLPLVVEADVSLLAFWGLMLIFRFDQLSSIRIELMKNLWDIGFKKREFRNEINGAKDENRKEFLRRLNQELEEDAKIRRQSVEELYQVETITIFSGLLAVAFLVASIAAGIYAIGVAHAAELVDPLTYFVPSALLFTGVMFTISTVLFSSFKLNVELESRQLQV
jgi:hypothetical protein